MIKEARNKEIMEINNPCPRKEERTRAEKSRKPLPVGPCPTLQVKHQFPVVREDPKALNCGEQGKEPGKLVQKPWVPISTQVAPLLVQVPQVSQETSLFLVTLPLHHSYTPDTCCRFPGWFHLRSFLLHAISSLLFLSSSIGYNLDKWFILSFTLIGSSVNHWRLMKSS